jgi:hypothetical protein
MTAGTRVGATLVAAALALGGAVCVAGPAQAATAPVQITKIWYDSPGSDKGANSSLNAEYVDLRNVTAKTQTITGWTLRDAGKFVYTFPKTTIAAGKTLRVHTGRGTASTAHRYWGKTWYVWNNDKDTATLRTKSGSTVDSCAYTSTAVDSKTC